MQEIVSFSSANFIYLTEIGRRRKTSFLFLEDEIQIFNLVYLFIKVGTTLVNYEMYIFVNKSCLKVVIFLTNFEI